MHLYGLIGNPIHHSKSPEIHTLFAKQANQNICYEAILVERNQLVQQLEKLQSQGFLGLNVTAPFKEEAFILMDQVSERAAKAKSINTIKFLPDGSRYGDNTDGIGLVRDLKQNKKISLKNKKILLLGAGGAVRGILPALLDEKPDKIKIYNRTQATAIALIEEFPDQKNLSFCDEIALRENVFDLIINATSAHHQDSPSNFPPVKVNSTTLCYDLTYSESTPFMKWAIYLNMQFYNGLGMLIEQAAESFHVWRGYRPDTALCHIRGG